MNAAAVDAIFLTGWNMSDDEIKAERAKTAQYRFYSIAIKARETYPFHVCDAGSNPQSIARFKSERDAANFLLVVRQEYVDGIRD